MGFRTTLLSISKKFPEQEEIINDNNKIIECLKLQRRVVRPFNKINLFRLKSS